MNINLIKTLTYLKSFLLNHNETAESLVYYGSLQTAPSSAKLVIVQSTFFEEGIYGTTETLPKTPFKLLPDTDIPFLFGSTNLEKQGNRIILYADLIASSYFLLSRYEELLKPECRDLHGRFLAKDAVVFQQNYGSRPLVDEWGLYLRNLLRSLDIELPEEKKGFSKIYLTHDVDVPFKLNKPIDLIREIVKRIIHYKDWIQNPIRTYLYNKPVDPFYSFPQIIQYDSFLIKALGKEMVESIYFLISKGSSFSKKYANVYSKKYRRLVNELSESGAKLGLHISYEAGKNPELIKDEIRRLSKLIDVKNLKSRHHYLKWEESYHVDAMEEAGITDDYTLQYADNVGFRVGTCKPYRFINPKTQRLTNLIEHPLEIMECTLDREQYMCLSEQEAFRYCFDIIERVKRFNGELTLLWHNTTIADKKLYSKRIYSSIIKYLVNKLVNE